MPCIIMSDTCVDCLIMPNQGPGKLVKNTKYTIWLTYHGYIANNPLLEHTTKEMGVNHAVIAANLRVPEDIKTIIPIARPLVVIEIIRPELVDLGIELVLDEELADVGETAGYERVIGPRLPLCVYLDVDVWAKNKTKSADTLCKKQRFDIREKKKFLTHALHGRYNIRGIWR